MSIEVATLFTNIVIVIALFFLARELRDSIQEVRKANILKMGLLTRLEKTVDRMEKHTGVVAENLASSISRADAADDAVPGSSADAALRTGQQ